MDIVTTKNDHEAHPESRYSVAGARKDKEGEQSFCVLSNKQSFSSNIGLAEELDLATALRPLSGWRFAAVTFS
jgi:hypothetical protein